MVLKSVFDRHGNWLRKIEVTEDALKLPFVRFYALDAPLANYRDGVSQRQHVAAEIYELRVSRDRDGYPLFLVADTAHDAALARGGR